jgi:hypothetical protein
MGKKRKPELDLDSEKTLYTTFVSAANSVSQIYTQAIQQQRKASTLATKHALENVLAFALKENPHSDSISKSALIHFLNSEYEAVSGTEILAPQVQLQYAPLPQPSASISDDESLSAAAPHRTPTRGTAGILSGNSFGSSRRTPQGGFSAMDINEHQDRVEHGGHAHSSILQTGQQSFAAYSADQPGTHNFSSFHSN